MAEKNNEFLLRVKNTMENLYPGLYEHIESSSRLEAARYGANEHDIPILTQSLILEHCSYAIMGNEISFNSREIIHGPYSLYEPSDDQIGFVNEILDSGYMRGAHLMQTLSDIERSIPGFIISKTDFDDMHITMNDMVGMLSFIATKNEHNDTALEQDFLIRLADNAHIRDITGIDDSWVTTIGDKLISEWGGHDPDMAARTIIKSLSDRKREYDRNAEVKNARESLQATRKRISEQSMDDSYEKAVSDLREVASQISILAKNNSVDTDTMPVFILANGSRLLITPVSRGEYEEPMLMGIYNSRSSDTGKIDISQANKDVIFYPLDSPEMEALIKASGGFSNKEYLKQAAHDKLVQDITDALAKTNENDRTGLRDKAYVLATNINTAVVRAKKNIDEKEIQGILDGIQINTLDGHRLAFGMEDGSLVMKYAVRDEEYQLISDISDRKAYEIIQKRDRVDYFINISDFEHTVSDAKDRIISQLKDHNVDSLTMSVVKHSETEIAYYNFKKEKDANKNDVIIITDVTNPERPSVVGKLDPKHRDGRSDLDWVYYGATIAAVGEPYQEERKVNKALENGQITIADKYGKPKTYKVERDEDGKVIGIDGNNKKIRVESAIAKEEAPDVAIFTRIKSALINRKAVELFRNHGLKGFVNSIEARGHNATDELTIASSNGTKTKVSITYNAETKKFDVTASVYDGNLDKDGQPIVRSAKQTLTKEQLFESRTLAHKLEKIVRSMTKTPDDVVIKKTVHLRDRLGKSYGLQASIMAGDAKRLMEKLKKNNIEILKLVQKTQKEEKKWEKFVLQAQKKGINYALREEEHKQTLKQLADCTKEYMDKNIDLIRRAEIKALD